MINFLFSDVSDRLSLAEILSRMNGHRLNQDYLLRFDFCSIDHDQVIPNYNKSGDPKLRKERSFLPPE